jgi:hypothetical protein
MALPAGTVVEPRGLCCRRSFPKGRNENRWAEKKEPKAAGDGRPKAGATADRRREGPGDASSPGPSRLFYVAHVSAGGDGPLLAVYDLKYIRL